jgi:tetratricopeptide (TPR) repeat protein
MPRKKDNRGREERVEEILRPSPYLGYNRDSLARHLVGCGALKIAESQFRRAIWLNPFEPAFKQHLAVCLQAQKQYAEAKEWIVQALQQQPDNKESLRIQKMIEEDLRRAAEGAPPTCGS